jgi:Flp pilus assembly pilin Flp
MMYFTTPQGAAIWSKAVHLLLARVEGLFGDENGATSVEYVVIASVLGLALIPVLSDTSQGVAGLFQRVNDYFAAIL